VKAWHWILAIVVLYEAFIGVTEVVSGTGTSSAFAAVATWPSVGSLVQSSSGVSTTVAGGVDLGTAALLYFLFLHGHLF